MQIGGNGGNGAEPPTIQIGSVGRRCEPERHGQFYECVTFYHGPSACFPYCEQREWQGESTSMKTACYRACDRQQSAHSDDGFPAYLHDGFRALAKGEGTCCVCNVESCVTRTSQLVEEPERLRLAHIVTAMPTISTWSPSGYCPVTVCDCLWLVPLQVLQAIKEVQGGTQVRPCPW